MRQAELTYGQDVAHDEENDAGIRWLLELSNEHPFHVSSIPDLARIAWWAVAEELCVSMAREHAEDCHMTASLVQDGNTTKGVYCEVESSAVVVPCQYELDMALSPWNLLDLWVWAGVEEKKYMGVLTIYQSWCVVEDSCWEDTRLPEWKGVTAVGHWMGLWHRLTFVSNPVLVIVLEISSLKSDVLREEVPLRYAYTEEAGDWDTWWWD